MLWLRKYSVRMYGHYTLKYSRRHHRHRGIIGNLCTLFNTSQRLKLFYRIDRENLKTIKIWVILNFIFIIFLCWHLAEVLFYLIVIRQFYQQWYKYNPYYHERVSLPLRKCFFCIRVESYFIVRETEYVMLPCFWSSLRFRDLIPENSFYCNVFFFYPPKIIGGIWTRAAQHLLPKYIRLRTYVQ